MSLTTKIACASFSLVLIAGAPPAVHAQSPSVTGTVTYRERIALPPSAIVEVTLEDVSRADAMSDVVARARLQAPGQPPIPFQVPFDMARINQRGRYAIRARILDGERVLFASSGTSLVITQGRGTRADLVLTRVSSPVETPRPGPAVPPAAGRPLPPVVELTRLPATFAGSVTCDGCAPARYELSLFPDDSFYLRTTPPGRGPSSQDDLGSWILSSDRRVIVLRTSKGTTEMFAIRDGNTLRRLDANGREVTSGQPSDLRRMPSFTPPQLRLTVSGSFVRTGDAGRLVECSTGQTWTVAGESPVRIAPPATATNRAGTLVSVTGRLDTRRAGEAVFVIDRVEPSNAHACPPRFAALPMAGTYWRLTDVGSTPIPQAANIRNEPSITFRTDARTFSGTGGCNRLTGRYQMGPESLVMTPAGTLMACPTGGEHEAVFGHALTATRRYRILGSTLEFFDETGQRVARFEAR